jgi:hypothetical protein
MKDWTRDEVEAIIADYFAMLELEIRGEAYSKAEHNRHLRGLLHGRTAGSVERKHQNISAILLECGYYYIPGYKPLSHYQKGFFRDQVLDRVTAAAGIGEALRALVENDVPAPPAVADILSILVGVPTRPKSASTLYDGEKGPRHTADWPERDQRNRSLGIAGEELVLRFERERLRKAGQKKLADNVEHVAVTRGDQVGYDIHSFEKTGAPRLIEVKTTRFPALTPFYATRNEVEVSDASAGEYHLYRLYQFTRDPHLFVLSGALTETCDLDPANYIARIAYRNAS